jgi:hypothetical protein
MHKPENRHLGGRRQAGWEGLVLTRETGHSTHEPLISPAMLEEVPLAGLSLLST